MKKFCFFITLAFSLFLSFSSKADSEKLNPIEKIKARGTLIVAMHKDSYYPFFMNDKNGKLYGSDVEKAEKIASLLGVKLKIDRSADTFDKIIENVITGKADIAISSLSYTLERAQRVLFSEPYITTHPALLINRLAISKAKKDTLGYIKSSKKPISAINNSSHSEMAAELFPDNTIIASKTDIDGIKKVIDNKAIAYLGDEIVVRKYIKQNPGDNLYLKPLVISEMNDYISIVVAAENCLLKEWLNGFIRFNPISQNPEELFEKYPYPE